jgi:hypothetical protein
LSRYQFSISIGKSADKNSASTKAVKDCIHLFSLKGYKDYNLSFSEELGSFKRYLFIFIKLYKFYRVLKKDSIVGIQYPLLNNVFKYFIQIAKIKRVKFFCILHDIESLRLGGQQNNQVSREVLNLNYYDCLIVHNDCMLKWLQENGSTTKMISLGAFDYLLNEVPVKRPTNFSNTIVFAGNLAKSNFIYSLSDIPNWNFNIYGPNYTAEQQQSKNVVWKGEFPPEKVVFELAGNLGLIWDGDKIDECDEILGNYLKYNNPHKFSLYLAAGLPVIAPKSSAISDLISEHNIGILIGSLTELKDLNLSEADYKVLQANCMNIQKEIIQGKFFLNAINTVERELSV